jgi:hypothetical protein
MGGGAMSKAALPAARQPPSAFGLFLCVGVPYWAGNGNLVSRSD